MGREGIGCSRSGWIVASHTKGHFVRMEDSCLGVAVEIHMLEYSVVVVDECSAKACRMYFGLVLMDIDRKKAVVGKVLLENMKKSAARTTLAVAAEVAGRTDSEVVGHMPAFVIELRRGQKVGREMMDSVDCSHPAENCIDR